ncbi:uncharacterized protein CLUP02_04482 [Colletotrichum lupini]|uniref:Uncharacterized protein n=1 Tax=Colletotrichum lupini TaxID=145971 RepID=A0A9Q8SKR7_9PEZI|nr:uncharacterized protein CLUP02_04482 [Colletotrichum lupini]UQC79003.1 hypothetical protein CLUP02_04482 [Colletotrichum lupini]
MPPVNSWRVTACRKPAYSLLEMRWSDYVQPIKIDITIQSCNIQRLLRQHLLLEVMWCTQAQSFRSDHYSQSIHKTLMVINFKPWKVAKEIHSSFPGIATLKKRQYHSSRIKSVHRDSYCQCIASKTLATLCFNTCLCIFVTCKTGVTNKFFINKSTAMWEQANEQKERLFALMTQVEQKLAKKKRAAHIPLDAASDLRHSSWSQVLTEVERTAEHWKCSPNQESRRMVFIDRIGRHSESLEACAYG